MTQLERTLGVGEASVSAQLRNARKAQYGAHIVLKRWRENNREWEYKLEAK